MGSKSSYNSTQGLNDGLPRHTVYDTAAEMPSSGINEGDTAYSKDDDKFYKATSATTWSAITGGAGASAFSDLTGTASVAQGGTGASSGPAAYTNLGQMPASNLSGTLSMAAGGTGQSNAADIRTALGLGSLATQSSVAASSLTGSIALVAQSGLLPLATGTSGTLAMISGGTNASNATDARTNLGLGSVSTLNSVALVTNTTGTLSIAQGGTGASSGSAAYTNLGTMGASNLSGTVAVVNGGTGQSNVSAAINALLPSQSGNSGKYLTTDATNVSWGTPSAGVFTTVRKTGLEQGSATTSAFVSVGQMEFSLSANTNYVYEFWIRYRTAATTTGVQIAIETPASPVGNWMQWTTPLAATGTLTGGSASGSNTTLSMSSGVVGSGAQLGYLTGMVMNGSNAGTMQLKFCSEVSGSLTSIMTGTMGRIMSIA